MSDDSIDLLTEEQINQMKKETFEKKEALEDVKTVSETVSEIKQNEEWIELKSLPSNDKVYPKGTKFFYKKYTYNDILKINNADIDIMYKYQIMLQGIRSDLTSNVNPLFLTFEDFAFISTVRRLESFGASKFSLSYTCPFCKNTTSVDFTLQQLEFDGLEIPRVPLKIRFSQYPNEIFEFSPITIGDIIWLMENEALYSIDENGNQIIDNKGNKIYDEIALISKQCLNHDFLDVYKKLFELYVPSDIELLTKMQNMFKHSIKPYRFKCTGIIDTELPPNWDSFSEEEKENYKRKERFLGTNRCNKDLSIEIGADTILIPFRESNGSANAGIFFD